MGTRGPRKKLAELNRLDGNPSNRPFELGCEIEAAGDVFIPDHLHDDAAACVEVIKRSMPPKVYAAADSFLLAAFGTAWAIHKRAAFTISDPDFEWVVLNSAGTQTPNPWIRVLNSQAQIMASLGDRLGLDPKARASLKLPAEKATSKFDGLVGGTAAKRRLAS